jgi:hypothetical protein
MCKTAPSRMTERPRYLCGRHFMPKPMSADPGEAPDPDKSPGAAALAAGTGVLVARSNWHVHALGRGGGGGVRWNVTFGRVQQLSLPALRALVDEVDMPLRHTGECARVPASCNALGVRKSGAAGGSCSSLFRAVLWPLICHAVHAKVPTDSSRVLGKRLGHCMQHPGQLQMPLSTKHCSQPTEQSRCCAPPAEDPGLLIGAQNALLCYDPRSGLQRWSVPFDSPLVAAFPGGSATNMLPGAHCRLASLWRCSIFLPTK